MDIETRDLIYKKRDARHLQNGLNEYKLYLQGDGAFGHAAFLSFHIHYERGRF